MTTPLQPLALVLAGLLLAGCGPRLAPVSGKVTLDGKPLVRASVVFQPESDLPNPGPGSIATTDEQGRYALRLVNGQGTGAIPGKHRVSITAYEGDADVVPSSGSDMPFRKALLPEEYNAKSKLVLDVPAAGTDKADFALNSRGK